MIVPVIATSNSLNTCQNPHNRALMHLFLIYATLKPKLKPQSLIFNYFLSPFSLKKLLPLYNNHQDAILTRTDNPAFKPPLLGQFLKRIDYSSLVMYP
jgi:hypothetical protein